MFVVLLVCDTLTYTQNLVWNSFSWCGFWSLFFFEWSLEPVLEWSLESLLESNLESCVESIWNSILPIYNNTKQIQKRSNELKIVWGRLVLSSNIDDPWLNILLFRFGRRLTNMIQPSGHRTLKHSQWYHVPPSCYFFFTESLVNIELIYIYSLYFESSTKDKIPS